MCSSGAWAFSSGRPKPIRTHGTLKVSYICVTKGMEPPSRMKTAFLPNPFSKADCAFLKMGLLYGATHGFPVLKTSNLQWTALGEGFRWNDGLGAFALIAAPDAVQFERGADPKAFDSGEACLAEITGRADSFFEIFFLPGQRVQRLALGFGSLGDLIVEARYGDAIALVVKLGKKLGQNGEGIGNGAAIYAGV